VDFLHQFLQVCAERGQGAALTGDFKDVTEAEELSESSKGCAAAKSIHEKMRWI
jgi:hypothetical protein